MATEMYGYPNGQSLEIYGDLMVKDKMMAGKAYHLSFKTGMAFVDGKESSVEKAVKLVANSYGIEWHNKEDKDVTVHICSGVGLKFDSILAFKLFCMSLVE